jgi:hypothetical protein
MLSSYLIDDAKNALFDYIKIIKTTNKKLSIIFENDLISFFGIITNMDELKLNGITSIYSLNNQLILPNLDDILIITRSNFNVVTKIIDLINKNKFVHYYIAFVPEYDNLCKLILENNSAIEHIRMITKIPIYFLPLYDDLFILNNHSNHQLINGLLKVQKFIDIYGKCYFHGIGSKANFIINEIDVINEINEINVNSTETEENLFILFDRDLDLLTPLCTQLTYSGLIDELIQIQCRFIKFESTEIYLNDLIYEKIKHKMFTEVATILRDNTRELKINYDKIQTTNNIECSLIKKVMKETINIPHVESHLKIAKKIQDTINNKNWRFELSLEQKIISKEELTIEDIYEILKINNFHKIIRLLSMISLLNNGLHEKYEYIISIILNKFGFDKMELLNVLFKKKILCKNDKNVFSDFDIDIIDNEYDISKLYLGYVPLSIKIIDKLFLRQENNLTFLSNNSKLIENYKKMILKCKKCQKSKYQINNNNNVDNKYDKITFLNKINPFILNQLNQNNNQPLQIKRNIYLVFIGGITYSEYASIKNINKDIIILTNNLINGNSFIDNFLKNH